MYCYAVICKIYIDLKLKSEKLLKIVLGAQLNKNIAYTEVKCLWTDSFGN